MAIGRNSETLIGLQTNPKEEATIFTKYLATSNSMNSEVESQQSEALTGQRFVTDEIVTSINCGGEIGLELTKDSLVPILKLAGLTEKTEPIALTDDSGAATGEYLHSFTVDNNVTNSATIIKNLTDEDYYEKYIGCKINSLDLSIAKKAYITASLNVLGLEDEILTGDPKASVTVSELADVDKKLYAYGTKITLGGAAYEGIVDEFNLSLSNNFDDDDRGLNDIYRRDLTAQGSELTFDFQAKFDKTKYMQLKDMMKNNTYTDLKVELANGIVVNLPKVKLTESSSPVDGPDKITLSINGSALYDASTATVMEVSIKDLISTKY
jgi:hypothetical protein